MLLALLLATAAVCSTASSVLTVPVEWKDDSSPNKWQVAPYKLDWVYDRGHEELWALGVSAPPVAVFTPAPAPSTPASTDSEVLYSTVDEDLEGGDAKVPSSHKWDSTPEVLYQKLTPTTAPQIPIYGEAPVTVSYVRPQQESSLRELLNNYVRVRSSRVDAARHGEVAKIHSVIRPEYTAVKTETILQPIDVLKRVETVQRVVKPVLKITPVYSQLTSVRNYPAPPAPVVKKVVQNILPAPIVKKYFVSPPPVVKNVWKNILPPPILKKYFVSPPPVVQNVVKKILPAPIIKRYFITPTPIVNKIVRNVLPPPIIKKYLVSPPPVVKRVAVLPPPIINRYVVMPPPVIKHYFVEEPHGEVSSRNSTPTLSPITPVSNDPVPTTFSYPTTTPAPSTTPAPITTPAPTTTPTPTTTPLSTTTPVVEMFTNQVENLRSASLVQNSQSQEEVKKSTSEEVRKTTSEGEESSSKVAVQNVELEIPGVQSVGKVVVVETVRRVVDVDTLGSSAMEMPARSEQTVVDADGTVRKFERYVVYDTVPIKRRVVAQIPASIAEENKKSFVASMNSALVSSSFQGGQRWTVPSLSSSDRMVLETGRGISSDSALSSAALASTSSRATIQDGNWVLRYLSPATASTHSAIVQTAGDAEVLSNSAQRVLSSSQTVKTSSASQASRMESSSQVEAAAVKSSSASKGSSQQTAMQVDSQDREYQSTASQASRMESSSQVEATAVESSSASKVFSQQTATQVDSQDREYQSKMRADSQSRGQQRALRVDSLDYQNAMQSDSQDRHHQQSALRADSQVIGHQSKQRAQHIMSISESLAASRAFHSKSSESLSSQQDARDSTTREGSVDQPAVVIKDLKNIGVLPEDMTVSSVTVKTT